jgi:hypothetical protein
VTRPDDIAASGSDPDQLPSGGAAWLITLVVCSWIPILAVVVRCYRGAHG